MGTRFTFAITCSALAIACSAPAKKQTRPLTLELQTDSGEVLDAEALRGKVLIVHVFTTWSLPAKDDAFRLETAFGKDDRVNIVGVVIDEDPARVIGAWRRGMEITYRIALGSDEVRLGYSQLGKTAAVPMTLVYDDAGNLLERIETPLGAAGIAAIRKVGKLAEIEKPK